MATIGIFGSSFNPPTGEGGHLGLVRWALRQSHIPLDRLWVLPVYRHIYQEKSNLARFEHRLKMAELMLKDGGLTSQVQVSALEKELSGQRPNEVLGSVDIIRAVQRKEPEASWVLLLGQDTYNDLLAGRWKESEKLLSLVKVLAVSRPGIQRNANTHVVAGLEELSSSDIRQAIKEGREPPGLTPSVRAYVQDHKLYQPSP